MTPKCCNLSCGADAEWMLIDGPQVDDYTEACTIHVGSLIQEGRSTIVVEIDHEPPAYPWGATQDEAAK